MNQTVNLPAFPPSIREVREQPQRVVKTRASLPILPFFYGALFAFTVSSYLAGLKLLPIIRVHVYFPGLN